MEKLNVYIDKDNKQALVDGNVFGKVLMGRTYLSNFNEIRISIKVFGLDRKRYYGTFFHTCDFAVIKQYKHQKRRKK